MTDSQEQTTIALLSKAPQGADSNPRMKLYEERERDFMEFVKETPLSPDVEDDTEDRPLSGLQCLLVLTEILEKAAQLRLTNFDLEQRIQVLQRLKQIAEVQSDLRNAKLDINANGLPRGRKAKVADELDGGRLKRTLSAESINTSFHTPISKFDQSDDFSKHRATHGKGSRLSETWGKVKDKLAHKETTHTHTPLTSKPSRRSRASADHSVPLRHSISADSQIPSHNSGAGQFIQREINISPTTTEDFGGVWLGDDTGDGGADTTEYGGVWLGPPSASLPPQEVSLVMELNKNEYSKMPMKEELERQSSDPLILRTQQPRKPNSNWSRVRSTSNDESQDWVAKTQQRDNQSPPPLRKKSSKPKLLALLPGSEQKRTKKGGQGDELPKEFRKKIEEWHSIKEAESSPATAEVAATAKSGKGTKVKNQRFKNKKKGGLLKQRSKSAERVEESSVCRQHSDDFEEKLREWSVKQGYHPTYYSEIRTSRGSSDSISEVSSTRESRNRLANKDDHLPMGESASDQSLTLNTQISSCDSHCSLSPSANVYFHSAENLQTLYEISQSADIVFHRESSATAQASRTLSRSEEAINNSLTTTTLLLPQMEQSASANSSHVDLYARASDRSLEKHLSLYHVTSETSIHDEEAVSSQDDTARSSQYDAGISSSGSLNHLEERSLTVPSVSTTVSTCTLSSHSGDLELPTKEEVVSMHVTTTNDFDFTNDLDVNTEPLLNVEDLCVDYDSVEPASQDHTQCNGVTGCSTEISHPLVEEGEEDVASDREGETSGGTSTLATQYDPISNTSDNTLNLHPCQVDNDSNLHNSTNPADFDVETSFHSHSTKKFDRHNGMPLQLLSVEDHSYDINSNVTDSSVADNNVADDVQAETSKANTSSTATSLLHLGTDIPLKARLKTLALEYESEDLQRHQSTTHYVNNAENGHKKSSCDLGSSTNPSVSYSTEKLLPKTGQTAALVNNKFNHLTKPHHSNLNRLKSADELIYEQSAHPSNKIYSRQTTIGSLNLPKLEIRSRREMHEKPKEGTVKKALSMFIDGGTFNTQFGTDFARPTRPQPT